jgi:hypothetical protein
MRLQHVQQILVAVAMVALGVSVPSLWAASRATLICCADGDDCPYETLCCDPALIGEDPCSLERPGMCQEACMPINSTRHRSVR